MTRGTKLWMHNAILRQNLRAENLPCIQPVIQNLYLRFPNAAAGPKSQHMKRTQKSTSYSITNLKVTTEQSSIKAIKKPVSTTETTDAININVLAEEEFSQASASK